jgi:hypothetical protein
MMSEPSIFRLNLLRAGYLLLVVGLGTTMWPQLVTEGPALELMHGVVLSMLCALGLLSVLGLFYPLRMLPLLLFEVTWKVIWLLRIALPLWMAHRIDAATSDMLNAVLLVVVFPLVIPWDHVARTYLMQPPERWRPRKTGRRGHA